MEKGWGGGNGDLNSWEFGKKGLQAWPPESERDGFWSAQTSGSGCLNSWLVFCGFNTWILK